MTTPCRFFALGSCTKGRACPYAHSTESRKQTYCQFYLQGNCRFGDRCALPHIKPGKPKDASKKIQVYSMSSKGMQPTPIKVVESKTWTITEKKKDREPLCPFQVNGGCKFGDDCKYVHGIKCPNCDLPCIHPEATFEEKQEHYRNCKPIPSSDEDKECSICMEIVREKQDPRFGLLDCDHCACLDCIRNWRGKDGMNTSKLCPICRTVTHFVTPSTVWPTDESTKQEIIRKYKENLKKIDCRLFDFGNGSCPFGTSCFYKHADKNGNVDQIKLRHLFGNEEEATIMKQVQLSDFFG